MDRVTAIPGAALVALAGWWLLGQQGARLGPFGVPELSSWWLMAGAVALVLLSRKRPSKTLPRGFPLWGIGLAVSFGLLALWRSLSLYPPLGIDAVADGKTFEAPSLQLTERRELRRLVGRRRNVEVDAAALLYVPRTGRYRFDVYCDDQCQMVIGDETIEATGRASRELDLARGDVPFRLHYRQEGGPATLVFSWRTPRVVELLPIEYFLSARGETSSGGWRRFSVNAALIVAIAWWCGFSLYLVRLGEGFSLLVKNRALPVTAAALLIAYGSLLRLEAFLSHSGLATSSSAVASLHEKILPVTPPYAVFNPENAPDDPYRADVRSYLDRAERMTLGRFYEASFREPFYVLLTKPFLWLSRGEIGVLIQSFFFSCLTLLLFFLVARSLHGAHWALALLVPIALNEWLILEAPTGYRMSAYGFFLLAFWWSQDGPLCKARSVGGGMLAGLTSLIRLSALSVIVPLAAVKLWPPMDKKRLAYGGTLAAVTLVLVAPFLWSNYRAHGDPLYSISFHTEFWLRAEGLDHGQGPVSLERYFTDFGRLGHVARGTLAGMTFLPIATFWNGLRHFPVLDGMVIVSGVVGLLAALTGPRRSLLVAYLGHLLPFAYIQNFPSGEMPRFVMPAYLFLVLAVPFGVRTLARPWKRPSPE